MNTKEWTIVIAVVIVIAILASLVSVKMTGNVVNVPISSTSVGVYTKTEVDSKFYDCRVIDSGANNLNCIQICNQSYPTASKKCMFGQALISYVFNSTTAKVAGVPINGEIFVDFPIMGCNMTGELVYKDAIKAGTIISGDIDTRCLCC